MTKIRWPALLLILALHAALVVSWTIQKQHAAARQNDRLAIQWLLPLPPQPRVARQEQKPLLRSVPVRTAQNRAQRNASLPARTPEQEAERHAASGPHTVTAAPIATPQANDPVAPPRADDPFAQPAPTVSAADIMRQAARDVAKIDHELRKGAPAKPLTLQQDSMQAKLEHAFNAAHDAVPPKWYEGARITELPSSDPHKKIFRINTALGDYCIYMSEDGRKSYANCPR